MKRLARRTLVMAAFVLVTSPVAAAPQPMINYFQPSPSWASCPRPCGERRWGRGIRPMGLKTTGRMAG